LAQNLKMDGDLSDWPAEALIPAWMTGCTMGEPNAEMYFAWSPEGIYGAVKVLDSKVLRHDPRGFWAGDAVEIYLDAADNKNHREANPRTLCEFHEGDHHFWAVPIPEENRAYLGQWKSWEEIPQTIFDIPNVQSGAKTIDGGYVMEFLIPAAMIKNYQPESGKIGFNANIVVKGQRFEREVYWFRPKNWATNNWPMMWGTMILEK